MIEKMERIFLYGLTEDSSETVSRLMECGCVQINSPKVMADYEEIKDSVNQRAANVYDLEQTLTRLGQCIGILAPYGGKKGLFAKRDGVDFGSLGNQNELAQALKICEATEAAQQRIGNDKSEISKEEFLQSSLRPWAEMDLPLETAGTKSSEVILAILPSTVTVETLTQEMDKEELGGYLTQVGEDKDQRYLAALSHREKAGQLWELLRQSGGSRTVFDGLTGTAAENLGASKTRVVALEADIATTKEELAKQAKSLSVVQLAYDSTQVQIDCNKAEHNMLLTQKTYCMEAWVPERKKKQVEKTLDKYTCAYEFKVPESVEETPVLLKNNKWVEPFETITEMYSLPASGSIDPNPIMAPFFFLFFGMMLSDAGYGIILTAAGLLGAKLLDVSPSMKKMLKMLGYCGISTIIWGALYGSWFGNAIPQVASVFFGKDVHVPTLIDPLTDPMSVLILSFVFGYIHILVGLGLKAYLMIRRGHAVAAFFDVGFWYFVLLGLPLLLVGGVVGKIGTYLALGGAAGLILTQGRDKKNPVMKLISGVMSLYDITGYFSDLLSYSRIMALGLATGVIGQVINTMGTLPGKNIFGVVLFVAVFLLGHTLNLGINALGSYVHSSRLQYVEFFGKFFEGGGEPFRPLRAMTKYVTINKQEEE